MGHQPAGVCGALARVVLEWRRGEGCWQGRVGVVVLDGQDTCVICAWFDQHNLTPAVLL